jgi:hypothetical protein
MEMVNSSDLGAYVIKYPNECEETDQEITPPEEREREYSSVEQEIALQQLHRVCGRSVR